MLSLGTLLAGLFGGWLGHALHIRKNELKALDKVTKQPEGSLEDKANAAEGQVLPAVEQQVVVAADKVKINLPTN